MTTSTQYLEFGTAENLSLIAIILSILFSMLTIILNRREKPNVMPIEEKVSIVGGDINHLILVLKNTSSTNLHGLTNLEEIESMHFKNKFLFTIGGETTFNFGFNLQGFDLRNKFYIRVRFKGYYLSRLPCFPKYSAEQVIWYSAQQLLVDGSQITLKLSTTHVDEIEKLEAKHRNAFKEYGKGVDKKFRYPRWIF